MASLSNINGLFDVHSTGAILFSTSHGTSGQILRSNGNAAPTWVAASTVIGGPYLPLTGGTLTGPLSGTSATFSGTVTTPQINLNSAGGGIIDNQTANIFIQTPASGGWIFRNGAPGYAERMRIDSSGDISFGGNSHTPYIQLVNSGRTAGNPGFSFYGDTNTGMFQPAGVADTIAFSTGGAERMRIDSNGDVTIGSSTLTGPRSLTLLSATNATDYDINFQQAGTTNFGRIRFTEGASDFQFFAQVSQDPNLTLQYGGNSFFSRGNVGIGTVSPAGKLEIKTGSSYTGHTQPNIKLINFGYRDAELNVFAEGSYFTHYFENYSGGNGRYYDRSLEIVCKGQPDGTYGEGVIKFKANPITAGSNVAEIMRITGAGKVGIGTPSPRAKLEVAGDITIQNGVYTYKTSGYTSGATAINVDITVGNEGGAGNVFKIEAGFAHYYAMAYNSVGEWWCTSRGTAVINTYILNAGTSLAGTWSSSKPNTTTLRVTKSAGTYGGGGKWWVKVTYVPF